MGFSGNVSGANAIKATLAAMPEVVRLALGEAVRVSASQIVQAAKARVPTGTGTLRDHINFSFSPTYARAKVGISPGTVVIEGHAYRASHYAHMVEFGTRAMPAHSFLGPAFRGEQSALESRMRAAQRASVMDLANVGSRYL